MDSYRLKEEQNELLKSVAELKNKIDTGRIRIKELHEEEIKYLSEIPEYKTQAEDKKLKYESILKQIEDSNKELTICKQKLKNIQHLVSIQEELLFDLKNTENKIIEETRIMNEQIKKRHEKLKEVESFLDNRERLVNAKEQYSIKYELELNHREVDLSKREEIHIKDKNTLDRDLEVHENNLIEHGRNLQSFTERKRFQTEDEQNLRDKLSKADRYIKEQIDLKASLLLQSEKLKKEIELTQAKQASLDKNIADLINQENALKIKELKIKKMVHDAGLVKELAELSI